MPIKNIIFYSKNLPPEHVGGIETFAINFIRLLIEDGKYAVAIVTQTKKKFFYRKTKVICDKTNNITAEVASKKKLNDFAQFLNLIQSYGFRPEETLVFYNTLDLNSHYLPLKKLGYRQVARSGGNDIVFMQRKDAAKNTFINHLCHLDKLILNSEYSLQRAIGTGLPGDILFVIKGGCGAENYQPISRAELGIADNTVVILSAGRLVDFKGMDDALDAVARLHQKQLDFVYLILGSGELKQSLESKASTLNITDKVHFIGAVPPEQVHSFYAISDIYLSTSKEIRKVENGHEYVHTETMGRSICEAQYYGLPVVATHAGGVPEMIMDGVTGLLIAQGDAVAIAGALEQLLTDKARRQLFSQQAKHFAHEHLSWDAVYGDWQRCLHEIENVKNS